MQTMEKDNSTQPPKKERVFNTPGVDEFLTAFYNLKGKLGEYVINIAGPHPGSTERHTTQHPYHADYEDEDAFSEWDQAFAEAINKPQQTPTTKSTHEQPRADYSEPAAVIAQAIATNRQASWLQNIPQTDVLAVINTVRALRAKGLDDWQAYKKYRLKAETNPALTQKVQILDALAGGTVGKNMRLPF